MKEINLFIVDLGISLRELGRRCGITPGAIHRRRVEGWTAKEAMLDDQYGYSFMNPSRPDERVFHRIEK